MAQLNIHITSDPEILDALRGLTQALKRLPSAAPAVTTVTPPIPTTAPAPTPVEATPAPAPTPATPKQVAEAPALAPAAPAPAADAPTPASALRALITAKGREVGVKLLQEFGAASMTGLKQEQHAAFIAKCQTLSAA